MFAPMARVASVVAVLAALAAGAQLRANGLGAATDDAVPPQLQDSPSAGTGEVSQAPFSDHGFHALRLLPPEHTAKINSTLALLGLEAARTPPPIGHVLLMMFGTAFLAFLGYRALLAMLGRSLGEEHAQAAEQSLDACACFAGIVIFFCGYGIAQEFIMTQDYNGERFPAVSFLILSNRLAIVAISGLLLVAARESVVFSAAKWTVIPGITVLVSSWCQYASLHYVTFPTQVVFKSAKIVPTMAVNAAVNKQFADSKDYAIAVVITVCVAGFSLLTESSHTGAAQSTVLGIALLCVFLLCDALTSNTEKRIFEAYKGQNFSNNQMMFCVALVSLVYSAVVVAASPGYNVVFQFMGRNPAAWGHIACLAVSSTCGQWLVYYIVRRHGPVLLAIMMTVRQVVSIFVSALLYGHHIGLAAAALAAVAFAACLARPLSRWLGGGHEKAKAPQEPLKAGAQDAEKPAVEQSGKA